MAQSDTIRTYFEGAWHDDNVPIMRAADHGSWLGSTVFDGSLRTQLHRLRRHMAQE